MVLFFFFKETATTEIYPDGHTLSPTTLFRSPASAARAGGTDPGGHRHRDGQPGGDTAGRRPIRPGRDRPVRRPDDRRRKLRPCPTTGWRASTSPGAARGAARRRRPGDWKSVVEGPSVSVRVGIGGRRIINKKNTKLKIRLLLKPTRTTHT